MKKLLVLVAAFVLAAFARAADSLPVFNAVLTIGKEHRFVLVTPGGKSSGFLGLGEKFEDFTLKSYDAKASTLEVERAGKVTSLTLATDAAIVNGGPAAPAKATLADAEEVFRVMRFDEMIGKMLDQQKKALAPVMQQSMGQALSKLPLSDEEKAAFATFQSKQLDELMNSIMGPEMRTDMAKAYSEIFNKQELAALANFYGTPAGQALIDKTPEVSAKMQETMMPRMMAIMPKLQQASRDFMTQTMAKHAPAGGAPAPMPAPAAK